MVLCPHCGHENLEGELFCDYCRMRLPRPSTQDLDAMYREQEGKWRARWRRDAIVALVWGLVVAVGVRASALSLDGHGGDPALVAVGERFWWLAGIAWGYAIWWFRRMASSER